MIAGGLIDLGFPVVDRTINLMCACAYALLYLGRRFPCYCWHNNARPFCGCACDVEGDVGESGGGDGAANGVDVGRCCRCVGVGSGAMCTVIISLRLRMPKLHSTIGVYIVSLGIKISTSGEKGGRRGGGGGRGKKGRGGGSFLMFNALASIHFGR